MVGKKTLGDLGWEVDSDNGWCVWFKHGADMICIDRHRKKILMITGNGNGQLSYAEIAAILDFIVEDAIY